MRGLWRPRVDLEVVSISALFLTGSLEDNTSGRERDVRWTPRRAGIGGGDLVFLSSGALERLGGSDGGRVMGSVGGGDAMVLLSPSIVGDLVFLSSGALARLGGMGGGGGDAMLCFSLSLSVRDA